MLVLDPQCDNSDFKIKKRRIKRERVPVIIVLQTLKSEKVEGLKRD